MKKVINYNEELKELRALINTIEPIIIRNPSNKIMISIFNHVLKRYKRLCKNESIY